MNWKSFAETTTFSVGVCGSNEAVNLETFERALARRVGVVERARVTAQEYNVVVAAAKTRRRR